MIHDVENNASWSRRAVQISYEAWLIGRDMDASKKILVATRILVFDFELFIGARCEKQTLVTAWSPDVSLVYFRTLLPISPKYLGHSNHVHFRRAR